MQYIKLSHEVILARYDEQTGKWHVRVRRTDTGEEFEDVADVLITAYGPINRWKMPNIEGLEGFKGEVHHSAGYVPKGKTGDEDANAWGDKKVAVIGAVSIFNLTCES